jgi:hypothetical protein
VAEWLRERMPGRAVGMCAAALAVLTLVAAVDLALTHGDVPAEPAECGQGIPECKKTQLQPRGERLKEGDRLSEGYEDRLMIYLLAAAVLVAAATVLALRGASRERRRRVFGNLGIAGVWTVFGAAGLVLAIGDDALEVDGELAGALFTLPAAMIIASGVGTVASGGLPARTAESADGAGRSGPGWLVITCWVLVGLTLAFAGTWAAVRSDCDPEGDGVLGAMASLSFATAGLGVAVGVVALFKRHWVTALATLLVLPVAFVLLLMGACFS